MDRSRLMNWRTSSSTLLNSAWLAGIFAGFADAK